LRELELFVVWKAEQRANSKTGKVPINDAGQPCDANSPANWMKFVAAFARWHVDCDVTGIGFALASSGFVVIDLDDVRDPVSGELKPWARELIKSVGSYSELSPSGRCVHIWTQGKWSGIQKWGGIEILDKGFVTVTGQRLPGAPAEIRRRQQPLDALASSDRHRIAKRRTTDRQFRALHKGELGGHASPSEADAGFALSLCWMFQGDPAPVERVMRSSGLYRSKWDERRGSTTYLQRTLDKVESLYREEARERGIAEGRDPILALRLAGHRISATREKVIRALSGFEEPVAARALAAMIGLTEDQVDSCLRHLLNTGAVRRGPWGGWELLPPCEMAGYRRSYRRETPIVDLEQYRHERYPDQLGERDFGG
jgi:primase-polymerase (primpol)-like protein